MRSLFFLFSLLCLARALSDFQRLVFRVVFTQDTERFHSDQLQTTPFQGQVVLSEQNKNFYSDGFLCIAEKIEDISNECTAAQNNNILFIKFDTNQDKTNSTYSYMLFQQAILSNVSGIIFNNQADFAVAKTWPSVVSRFNFVLHISEADQAQALLKQRGDVVRVGIYPLVICEEVLGRRILYLVMGVWWLVLFVWWMINNYYCFKLEAGNLQHLLTALPAIKLIDTVLVNFYLGYCPQLPNEFAGVMLELARVGLLIITQAVTVCYFILLSRGWMLLTESFSMCMSAFVSVFMCLDYISYISYMIADYDSIFGLVTRSIFTTIQAALLLCTFLFSLAIVLRLKVIIITLSLAAYCCISNLSQNLQRNVNDGEQNNIARAIRSKRMMQVRFLIISSLFFLIEVIIHGFFPYYQGSLPNYTFSGVFYKSTSIADELTYISIITALLINYRARNFVQFFSLVNLNEGLLSGYEYDGNLIAQHGREPIPLHRASMVLKQQEVNETLLNDITKEETAIIVYPQSTVRSRSFSAFQENEEGGVHARYLAIAYLEESNAQFDHSALDTTTVATDEERSPNISIN